MFPEIAAPSQLLVIYLCTDMYVSFRTIGKFLQLEKIRTLCFVLFFFFGGGVLLLLLDF